MEEESSCMVSSSPMLGVDVMSLVLLAGSKRGFSDGKGEEVEFCFPRGVAVHDSVIYVADSGNKRIRAIDLEGNVTTLKLTTKFSLPCGLTVGEKGELWVSDALDNTITSIKGSKETQLGGRSFYAPQSLCWNSSSRQLVVADTGNKRVVKIVDVNEKKKDVVFQGNYNCPRCVTVDKDGSIYVADSDNTNNRITRITPSNDFALVAGISSAGYLDAEGFKAKFNYPSGMAVKEGLIYVADTKNHTIRIIDSKLHVSTLSFGNSSTHIRPHDLAVHPNGSIVVVDSEHHRVYLLAPVISAVVKYEGLRTISLRLTNVPDISRQIKEALSLPPEMEIKPMIDVKGVDHPLGLANLHLLKEHELHVYKVTRAKDDKK